ncbi:S-layer homology domain-containing protein [Paenibacillus hamazuiensis]|uniref:S-layer homology domain-containing protein n=1 Tax=Paenibacillus hamazuiensis TaxID=2936508 RepID=UPI00200F8934|nr:S-layer homology domain-containing protein [Paenibacillus hamazuiensis]
MKKRIISALVMLSILLSMVPASVLGAPASVGEIGRVRVSTMSLPSTVAQIEVGTYTYSGKVLVAYKTANDIDTANYWNIAVVNDDGTEFKNIFSGLITPIGKGVSGFRLMPYQDNKRVLLGDYVLECTPNIDACTSSQLVPVEYPASIVSSAIRLWSEIIIAPDNNHMSWTTLTSLASANSYYGTLTRGTDKYTIENMQRVSAGEVKQFIHGGQAISSAGGRSDNVNTDSVATDLMTGVVTPITITPGYDETTIMSPDERLGLEFGDRFSRNTTTAIFGLFPIPNVPGLAAVLYGNAVKSVRAVRDGSIGPVLVDIDRSMNEDGYMGINLNMDPNWIYYSPMSWHPDGKRAMFMEVLRGTGILRIRIVKLLDYTPKTPVPAVTLPDIIPGALTSTETTSGTTRIDGKNSGYISISGNTKTYDNFSDDGVNFYNGYVTLKMGMTSTAESVFEANIKLTGPKPGEMNLRATFGPRQGNQPNRFLYDMASDGKPKTYGYSTYNGVTLYMDDLKDSIKALLDDTFDNEAVGAAPSWTVSQPSGTAVSIANENAPTAPGCGGCTVSVLRSVYLKDNSTINYAQVSKTFASQTGAVIAQWNFKDGSDVAGDRFQLRSGNTVAASVYMNGSGNLMADGTAIQKVSPNTWYNIKLAANPDIDKYDIYVNQILMASGIAFTTPVTSLDNVSFQTGAANQNSMFIDDVRVIWASNNLKGLILSAGSLTPNFDPNVTSYTLRVSNNVSRTTVTASVYDGGASVKINDNPAATEVASEAIALGVGHTAIPIVVTAQDGSQKTYNIDVIRAPSSSGRSRHSNTSSASSSATAPVPTETPAPTATATPAPTATPAQSSSNLGDVKSHWAEAAINKLVTLGAVSGYGDGSFKPNNNITRAEFITILVKAFKLEDKAGKTFTDTANHWAKDYISIATANGIAGGYNDSTFGPDDLITREQMAVMIYYVVKPSGVSSDSQFSDESALSSWAKAAVEAAKKNGIIEGYSDGSFKPQANATRAEAVTIIVKALGLNK